MRWMVMEYATTKMEVFTRVSGRIATLRVMEPIHGIIKQDIQEIFQRILFWAKVG